MCMTSAKYQPLELDDEEEHCVKICYEIILEDSPKKYMWKIVLNGLI